MTPKSMDVATSTPPPKLYARRPVDSPDGQGELITHHENAVGGTSNLVSHTCFDTQRGCAGEVSTPDRLATVSAPPKGVSLADPALTLAAEILDDLEKVWIANANRLRQLTRTETDSDGIDRGFGLTEDHPDVKRLAVMVDSLDGLQHQATLNLQRKMREHPLGPWVKATVGVGEKQAARLLAAIGDPYWNTLHDRPRTVSELWAYCGLHTRPVSHAVSDAQACVADGDSTPADSHPSQGESDTHVPYAWVAARRARGQKANWSATAKMRSWNIAGSCIKQEASPYRAVYDTRRAATADRVHAAPCVRCGPSGKPAQPGSPWSKAHQHADALRIVSKAVLRGLWLAARDLHNPQDTAPAKSGSIPILEPPGRENMPGETE